MGRYDTSAWQKIHTLCSFYGVQENDIKQKAKKVLSLYSDLVLLVRIEDLTDADYEWSVKNQLDALNFLENIDQNKSDLFYSSYHILNEVWFGDIVDDAIVRLADFQDGPLYVHILSKCYLTKCDMDEEELAKEFNIERTRIYDRKREAIIMFGICFWFYAIPQRRAYLMKQ